MVFYDTSNKYNSLYHDSLFRLGIDRDDTTTYPIADFTRSANNWYRRVNSWIWQSTGEWEYDDSNLTDLPIAVCDLVASQTDYTIPSTAQKIDRVEVKDDGSDWHKLIPMDKSELPDTALTEFEETAGLPVYYDVVGNSLFLYPAASSTETTLASGLKLYFSRDVDQFTTSDTTMSPGFVKNFHEIISIGSAIDFATLIGDLTRYNQLKSTLNELVTELKQFYGSRHRELRPRINRRYKTNKRT